MKKIFISIILCIPAFILTAQDLLYQDYSLSIEDRVNSLVSALTIEEKVGQMSYTAPAIERLGIPEYNWWNEALHGVARAGYATVFPQSITIAGSWDTDLMFRVGTAISDEARAKYHESLRKGVRGIYRGLTFWSPNINIFRDPRWGRGHETYGEDPYLTGQMGLQFVISMQGNNPDYLKTITTAKHYAVHSGPEPTRHEFNAIISERDLRETYLPAFRTLVVDGNVQSIMGAYNQLYGDPCCANPYLFSILRNEWKFDGYVVSDCWAISDFYTFQKYSKNAAEASAVAVKAGTDLNCGVSYSSLVDAFKQGLITEDEIDIAVKRLFTARFKLGMFDPDELNPYAQIPISAVTSGVHERLAREAAQKSIVLLKNMDNILPLSKEIKRIAVIGPNADNWEALVGNYNGISMNPVTVLEGLKNKLEPETEILYAEGCHLAEGVHNIKPIPSRYFVTEEGIQGIKGEYYANSDLEGQPVMTRIDDQINFYWESGSPSPELPDDNFSIRWTSYLLPPVTGTYYLGCWGMPQLSVKLEGKEILTHQSEHHGNHHEVAVDLEAGKKYQLVYEYKNWFGDGDAKLLWSVPNPDMDEEAIEIAKQSDAVILVMGLSQRLEGEEMEIKIDGFEGGDRTHLKLPSTQLELMEKMKETGKPVILVLMNGSALALNWEYENLNAIISAGYPGEQGGNAVADVLFGDYNPAGRLPVTYYKSVEQLPPFEDYDMEGRTYRYFSGEPLFPFGFGLSYTTFVYSDLIIPEKVNSGEVTDITVKVKNTGDKDGEEVVQLYITDEKASTPRPIRQLEGFKRVFLKAGEIKEVKFQIQPRQLSMIDKNEKRLIEPGWFSVSVGGKQPGFSGVSDAFTTGVITSRFKVSGKSPEFDL